MALHTRRRFLASAAAGALGVLAGCNGTSSSASESASYPPTSGETRADPDAVTLRDAGDDLLAWIPPADATSTSERPPRYAGRSLVASDATAERVEFADRIDSGAARDFLDATDYASETVYLEHRSVRACYRLRLCYVNWTSTSVHTSYGSYYRDADVACETERKDVTAWLVRIPDVLDPDDVTSHGSGWSSNGCRPTRAEIRDRTERPPLDVGPLPGNESADESANATGGAGR